MGFTIVLGLKDGEGLVRLTKRLDTLPLFDNETFLPSSIVERIHCSCLSEIAHSYHPVMI